MANLNYQIKQLYSCEAEGMHSNIMFYSEIKTSNGVFAEIVSKSKCFENSVPSHLSLSLFLIQQPELVLCKYHHLDSHTMQ